jgi:hypothetical protein
MTGASSALRCEGFIASDTFERSKEDLKRSANLTDRQLDDRLEGLEWALRRDPNVVAVRVRNLNLWTAVTPVGTPPLRIYLRPRPNVPTECELMWAEERVAE